MFRGSNSGHARNGGRTRKGCATGEAVKQGYHSSCSTFLHVHETTTYFNHVFGSAFTPNDLKVVKMQSFRRAIYAANGSLAIPTSAVRDFASSPAFRLPEKPRARSGEQQTTSSAAPPTPQVRVPTLGSSALEQLKYSIYMDRLRKLNPEVTFSKETANTALWKSVSMTMLRALWQSVSAMVLCLKSSSYRTPRAVSVGKSVKRLQEDSELYWAAHGAYRIWQGTCMHDWSISNFHFYETLPEASAAMSRCQIGDFRTHDLLPIRHFACPDLAFDASYSRSRGTN